MNPLFSIILSMTVAIFGGAAGVGEDMPAPSAKQAPSQTYEVIQAPYSDAIKQALRDLRSQGGYRVIHESGKSYIVISVGQRPTGGYQITIADVQKQADGSWLVQTVEKKPAPGMMVTQVLTYPAIVIALPEANARVNVQF